jgi:hypothetical protein
METVGICNTFFHILTLKLNPTRDVAFDVKFFDVGFCYTISVSKSKLFVFIITHSKQEALLYGVHKKYTTQRDLPIVFGLCEL